jgi:hypothetical protein
MGVLDLSPPGESDEDEGRLPWIDGAPKDIWPKDIWPKDI